MHAAVEQVEQDFQHPYIGEAWTAIFSMPFAVKLQVIRSDMERGKNKRKARSENNDHHRRQQQQEKEVRGRGSKRQNGVESSKTSGQDELGVVGVFDFPWLNEGVLLCGENWCHLEEDTFFSSSLHYCFQCDYSLCCPGLCPSPPAPAPAPAPAPPLAMAHTDIHRLSIDPLDKFEDAIGVAGSIP